MEKGAIKTYLVVHRSHQIVQRRKCIVMNMVLNIAKSQIKGNIFDKNYFQNLSRFYKVE